MNTKINYLSTYYSFLNKIMKKESLYRAQFMFFMSFISLRLRVCKTELTHSGMTSYKAV